MLRAILTNRLSTNNEAKENRSIHKTPNKKALNKTIDNNKSLKNGSSKKINKLQVLGSDLNSLNIINDDKELLKQNALKTPLKISQQRAPLSNIKKANVKEKSLKSLNNQHKITSQSIKKPSTAFSSTPTSSIKLNNKYHNENENIPLHSKSLKRQISFSSSTPNAINSNLSHGLKRNNSFGNSSSSQETQTKENIFITHMKNSNLNEINKNDEIEYMPPSLSHLEEEIEPKYKINYETLMKFKPVTTIDYDIFKRINEDIDIELDSETNAFKTKDFEFVDDFVLDLSMTEASEVQEQKGKNEKENVNINSKNKNVIDEFIINENNDKKKNKNIDDDNDEINRKIKDKLLNERLFQDFNLNFEEESEDEEVKLPDFLTSNDKDPLYFDEINL